MEKLRKGDEVEVITGKDRTKRGTIMKVLPKNRTVIVEALRNQLGLTLDVAEIG